MGVGSFTTVIVPRSAFEAAREPQQAHNLVQAVAKFVHTMMGQGLYTRDELLPKATHAFLAGYYLSQVNHGGHREFIHNNFVNIDLSLSDLRAALAAIGTEPYRSIAERLIAWCGERRDPVTHKIDLSNRGQSDFLGDLDREFTAADKASPLNNLLAGWIAAWPELRVVDDADYPEALRLSVTMNPLRSLRQQWRSVRRLQFQTTDRFQVAVGLACLKMQRWRSSARATSTITPTTSPPAAWRRSRASSGRRCSRRRAACAARRRCFPASVRALRQIPAAAAPSRAGSRGSSPIRRDRGRGCGGGRGRFRSAR
jgi:hypothetical protein